MVSLIERVPTTNSGKLEVFVQGDLNNRPGKIVFLAVHDLGTNHETMVSFVNNQFMCEVRRKAIFLHVCLLGQDANAPQLPDFAEFPSMDSVAHDLVEVLDNFKVKTVIAIGEGAGANIVCRLGFHYPNRCLGLILIDFVPSRSSVDENISLTLFKLKKGSCKMANAMVHPFSSYSKFSDITDDTDSVARASFTTNVGKFAEAYIKRNDISHMVAALRVEALVVVGNRGAYLSSAYKMNRMNPKMITLLTVDGVCDVLQEAPRNLTRALILFCKGCGVLLGVPLIGLEQAFKIVNTHQVANQQKKKALSTTNLVG